MNCGFVFRSHGLKETYSLMNPSHCCWKLMFNLFQSLQEKFAVCAAEHESLHSCVIHLLPDGCRNRLPQRTNLCMLPHSSPCLLSSFEGIVILQNDALRLISGSQAGGMKEKRRHKVEKWKELLIWDDKKVRQPPIERKEEKIHEIRKCITLHQ